MKRYIAACLACALLVPATALAWGGKGHTLISRLASEEFPATMPAFIRTPAAIDEIAALGIEEDRLKGSGRSWDADNDPGHYLDIGDDGTVNGVRLSALPASMSAYALALEAVHTTPWREGYLPYSIMDGFEQLRMDFAYWRVDEYGATHARTASLRAQFMAARALREVLTIRDLGVWSHFVADACQPLHVTIHFNGWGRYPDPHGYTHAPIHSAFESTFVNRFVTAADVRSRVPSSMPAPPTALISQSDLAAMIGTYLEGSHAAVAPLYRIESTHGFDTGSAAAIGFTAKQLARGVAELRNLSDLAWMDSLYVSLGYPEVSVKDILSGRVPLSPSVLGAE